MNKTLSRRGLLIGAGLLASTPLIARADTTDEILRDLGQAREGVRTLICPFTQERVLGLFSSTVSSHGELTLVRPDRLRWALNAPDEAIYWVTPEGIAYRTPQGKGKVAAGSTGALGAILDDILVLLGGDLTRLRAHHELSAERQKGGGFALTLVPKKTDIANVIRKLTIQIGPDRIAPKQLLVEEHGDDRSTITFGLAQRDVAVDPSKMRPS